jgi:hypothetical protein
MSEGGPAGSGLPPSAERRSPDVHRVHRQPARTPGSVVAEDWVRVRRRQDMDNLTTCLYPVLICIYKWRQP